MSKNTNSSGNSVFGQLLNFISRPLVEKAVKVHQSDRYCKKFSTYEHLVAMLYGVTAQCCALREVSSGIQAFENRLHHLGMKCAVPKSTLADANKRRDSVVFEKIHELLLNKYASVLSDSQADKILQRVKIIDSSTMSLFKEILKAAGRQPINGKRKGGIKAHAMMPLTMALPKMIWYTAAAVSDHSFLEHCPLQKGDIAVFDKGYNDYQAFEQFTLKGIGFVTRLKDNALYRSVEELPLPSSTSDAVMKDEIIIIEVKHENNTVTTLTLRLVHYWDATHKRYFQFLTNLFDFDADKIALLYKKRWQIELLFKKLKQNFQIKYFLGDNVNAIEIQLWAALIANLLFTLIQKQLKRKWAFSNLVAIVRLHLVSYFNLFAHLEYPDKKIVFYKPPNQPIQASFF